MERTSAVAAMIQTRWPIPAWLDLRPTAELSEADEYNAESGELSEFDCAICRNKGMIASMVNGRLALSYCKCHERRRTIRQMRKAGVDADKSFDNYKATKPWQAESLRVAKAFVDNGTGWLFVGGQVGAGKTHLCTAVINALMSKGYQCSYMVWKDDSTKLKAVINDGEQYAALIDRFKTAQVLYIDDFWKTRKGEYPTAGDINLAFELLNYRYNQKLITIISSERFIEEIELVDEAVGSRIVERCKSSCINIKHEKSRNYRTQGG